MNNVRFEDKEVHEEEMEQVSGGGLSMQGCTYRTHPVCLSANKGKLGECVDCPKNNKPKE